MSVDTASLYYLHDGQWSLVGTKDMEGGDLMRHLYFLLNDAGDQGPEGRAATRQRREQGDGTVSWNDQYANLTLSPGTGIAIVRTFDCWGNPVVYPDLPLVSGISTARGRYTDSTRPSIDLRAPQGGLPFTFVLDKITRDTESAGPTKVAVSRCSAGDFRKLALILTRQETAGHFRARDELLTSIVLRSVPDDQSEFRDMLLATHHPALAEGLDAAWQFQLDSAPSRSNNDLYMLEPGYDPTLQPGSYDGGGLWTPDYPPQALGEVEISQHAAQSDGSQLPGEEEDGNALGQRQPPELIEGTGPRWEEFKSKSGLRIGWYVG